MNIFHFVTFCCVLHRSISNCRFGPGCAFECNCQNNATCDPESGDCANGCADGPGVTEDVHNMRYDGPGCRIGNIAFMKPSNQSSVFDGSPNYASPRGNDGNTSGNIYDIGHSCIRTNKTGYHWWMVWLESLQTIYNVTFYGRTDTQDYCQFCETIVTVLINDDVIGDCGQCLDDSEQPCSPGFQSPFTFHCPTPLLGNKVILQRMTIPDSFPLLFCEAVVFGNSYINVSGEHCLNDSTVYDNVTGCPYCYGRQLPDCKLECENGTYGVNCNEVCGRCGTNESCGNIDGSCGAAGCQTWWHGDACQTEIAPIGYNSAETADVAVTSSNGSDVNYVNVTWKAIEGVPTELYSYYQYVVQYRISNSAARTIWLNSTKVNHTEKNANNELSTTLTDLEVNTEYLVQIMPFRTFGAISEPGSTSDISSFIIVSSGPGPGGDTGLIAGIAVALIVILVVVVLGFLYIRRRTQNDEEYKAGLEPISPVIVPEAIPTERPPDPQMAEYVSMIAVDNLLPVVLQKHIENDFGRFENFPPTRENNECDGNKPNNKIKNRYFAKPYDETRVRLKPLSIFSGDEVLESDYINASYISLPGSQPLYIAAEGPKLNTVNDFWRMVWQEQCPAIVMLANLVEKGKNMCEQYWPTEIDRDHEFGSICARTTRVEKYANYIVRRISLTYQGIEREIFQYHFTDWPDKDVPQSAFSLLLMRKAIRSQTQGLLVVHCSAGVGRTGTFIALDKMLIEAATQSQIDIDDFIVTLRRCRGGMVQTIGQYKFLHKAIAEGFLLNKAGETIIQPDDLDNLMKDHYFIQRINRQQSILAETAKFQTEISPINSSEIVALQKENRSKNRDDNVVPRNATRPYLITDNHTGSDYVNAVLADSSRRPENYVITQMPLANTVHDFWRLVVDYSCVAIVMLNPIGTEKEYWPAVVGTKSKHGSIQVTSIDVNMTSDCVITRKLNVKTSEKQMHVTQYQFLHWPDGKVKPPTQSIVQLLAFLERDLQSSDCSRLLIHCLTGSGHATIFCVLHYVIDMLRHENIVDVFQAVNHVRQGRPEFIPTMEQYHLIYELMVDYLRHRSQHPHTLDAEYANLPTANRHQKPITNPIY